MASAMVKVTTVSSGFEAKLIAARLGSEGVVWQLRGNVDSVYPMGPVDVLVAVDDFELAREILLVTAVEAAFDDTDEREFGSSNRPERAPIALLLIVAALCSASALAVAHMVINGPN